MTQKRGLSPAWRFAVMFAVLALAGFAALMHPWVEANIVNPFTAALVDASAILLRLFGVSVAAAGNVLRLPQGGAVAVENGCNAVEVCILLAAAILAWPGARWRDRVAGVMVCVAAIQAVNLLRIISLLFLVGYSRSLFEIFHLYVWEAMIMLEAVLVFGLWVRLTSRDAREAGPPPA